MPVLLVDAFFCASCSHDGCLIPLCSHVILPKELAKTLPKSRLLTESEWRGIGVQQSRGWQHYAIHRWVLQPSFFSEWMRICIASLFSPGSFQSQSRAPHPSFPSSFGYWPTERTSRSRIGTKGTWRISLPVWNGTQLIFKNQLRLKRNINLQVISWLVLIGSCLYEVIKHIMKSVYRIWSYWQTEHHLGPDTLQASLILSKIHFLLWSIVALDDSHLSRTNLAVASRLGMVCFMNCMFEFPSWTTLFRPWKEGKHRDFRIPQNGVFRSALRANCRSWGRNRRECISGQSPGFFIGSRYYRGRLRYWSKRKKYVACDQHRQKRVYHYFRSFAKDKIRENS